MSTSTIYDSLLTEPEERPLLPPESVAKLGTVVVLAPHPDDESLGCGGLLALLAERKLPAYVIVMTDGSRSHPASASHPASRLAAVREMETRNALQALRMPEEAAKFLRFGDCALPCEGQPSFLAAVARVREAIERLGADTLFVPWRRDPHCDHEATWSLARAAVANLLPKPRWVECPVWAWTRSTEPVAPGRAEAVAWRLDISAVTIRKQQAIAEHRSQLGAVIHDDPSGFVLEPAMLANFRHPWELFLDPIDG